MLRQRVLDHRVQNVTILRSRYGLELCGGRGGFVIVDCLCMYYLSVCLYILYNKLSECGVGKYMKTVGILYCCNVTVIDANVDCG